MMGHTPNLIHSRNLAVATVVFSLFSTFSNPAIGSTNQKKANQEKAKQEKANQEKANKEKANQEKANKEKANKEKANKEKANKEKAKQEKANQEKQGCQCPCGKLDSVTPECLRAQTDQASRGESSNANLGISGEESDWNGLARDIQTVFEGVQAVQDRRAMVNKKNKKKDIRREAYLELLKRSSKFLKVTAHPPKWESALCNCEAKQCITRITEFINTKKYPKTTTAGNGAPKGTNTNFTNPLEICMVKLIAHIHETYSSAQENQQSWATEVCQVGTCNVFTWRCGFIESLKNLLRVAILNLGENDAANSSKVARKLAAGLDQRLDDKQGNDCPRGQGGG